MTRANARGCTRPNGRRSPRPPTSVEWLRLYAVALYTGLRLGELRALTWADVDLKAGTLTVSMPTNTSMVCPHHRLGTEQAAVPRLRLADAVNAGNPRKIVPTMGAMMSFGITVALSR